MMASQALLPRLLSHILKQKKIYIIFSNILVKNGFFLKAHLDNVAQPCDYQIHVNLVTFLEKRVRTPQDKIPTQHIPPTLRPPWTTLLILSCGVLTHF